MTSAFPWLSAIADWAHVHVWKGIAVINDIMRGLVFWALKQQSGSSVGNYLLCVLADLYNIEKGCAWAGYAYLAERCACDRTTVKRHIIALEKAGLISVLRRRNASGQWDSHQYRFPQFEVENGMGKMPIGGGVVPIGGGAVAIGGMGTEHQYNPITDKPNYKTVGGHIRSVRTRDRSLKQDLTDTSWAD